MLDSNGLKSQDVILKPFSYSDLVSILKETRNYHTTKLIHKNYVII